MTPADVFRMVPVSASGTVTATKPMESVLAAPTIGTEGAARITPCAEVTSEPVKAVIEELDGSIAPADKVTDDPSGDAALFTPSEPTVPVAVSPVIATTEEDEAASTPWESDRLCPVIGTANEVLTGIRVPVAEVKPVPISGTVTRGGSIPAIPVAALPTRYAGWIAFSAPCALVAAFPDKVEVLEIPKTPADAPETAPSIAAPSATSIVPAPEVVEEPTTFTVAARVRVPVAEVKPAPISGTVTRGGSIPAIPAAALPTRYADGIAFSAPCALVAAVPNKVGVLEIPKIPVDAPVDAPSIAAPSATDITPVPEVVEEPTMFTVAARVREPGAPVAACPSNNRLDAANGSIVPGVANAEVPVSPTERESPITPIMGAVVCPASICPPLTDP